MFNDLTEILIQLGKKLDDGVLFVVMVVSVLMDVIRDVIDPEFYALIDVYYQLLDLFVELLLSVI